MKYSHSTRRVVAILLSIIMIVLSFPNIVFAESKNETLKYSEVTVNVDPGDDFSIRIKLTNNTGITDAMVRVNYNTETLILESVNYGGNFSKEAMPPETLEQSIITLLWSSEKDVVSGDVIYATLNFAAKDKCAENSKETIRVAYFPYDFIYKNPDSDGLTVSVMECIPGDINHDGKVSMLDLRQLREYLNTYNIEVLNYLLTQEVESPEELAMEHLNTLTDTVALDVNHDGAFTMLDVNTLARYIAHYNGYIYYGNRFSRMCSHKNLETILAKKPTNCAEAGNIEYWYCRDCNKYYSDWLCMDEISLEDTVVTGGAHSLEVISAVAATCTEAGNSEYWHCTKCGKYFADADGNNEITIESTVVNPKGHTVVIDAAVSPTYDSTGLTEGSHCSVCNTVLKAQEIVDKLEPTYHSVTYKDTKGAEIPADKMRYSEHEGLLDMPEISADGYKFKGWYTASEGGTKIDHITKGTTEDYVLYAHWEPIKYTITYNDSGVHENVESYTIEDRIVLKTPQWSGLQFVNWTDEDGKVVSIIEKGTTGNIILTANWKSYRNNVVPSKDSKLMSAYRNDRGLYYFAYKLGIIENVIVSSITAPYNKTTTAPKDLKLEQTIDVTESSMQSLVEMISKSTTHATSHIETEEDGNQHTSMRNFTNALTAEVNFGKKDVWGVKISDTATISGTWGDVTSHTESTVDTTNDSDTVDKSHSTTSTLSYSNKMSTSETTSITVSGDMPNGQYDYVYTTDVTVYAIIIYSPSEESYCIGTCSTLGDLSTTLMYYRQPADKYNATCDEFSYDNVSKDLKNAIADIIESSYYVEYAANGGKGTMKSSLHAVGEKSNLSPNGFNRDGYDFKGWATAPDGDVIYEDKSEIKDITEKGKIITLYAVWDVNPYEISKYVKENGAEVSNTRGTERYVVYNEIARTPQSIDGRYIYIIDWSKCSGDIDYIESVKVESTDEAGNTVYTRYGGGNFNHDIANTQGVYFIGNPNAKFSNMNIYVVNYCKGTIPTIHFSDFNIVNSGLYLYNVQAEPEKSVIIDVVSNSSIKAVGKGNAIAGFENITITGNGTLSVYGGDGADATVAGTNGGNGGTGIIAGNITVDMTGTLNVYGGNGGGGADGTNGTDGTGENGGRGGDGGAGNYAVRSESQIVVKNGTVNLHGGASGSSGRGGNGGKGTKGANGTANPNSTYGYPGGAGGKGGDSGNVMLGSFATNCGYIISDNCTATVYCEIGKTGNVGEPGNGGDGGDGGEGWWIWSKDGPKGADGSDGSYGRVLYDVTTAGVYNNADNGNVTHSVENGMLKITVSGEAAPGLGGFVQSTSSAPYKVFYHTIVAKVPVGYKLEHASNAIGDGAHFEWMTSNSGTGEFETYVYRTTCGSTGTFNDFGYVYLYADDYTTVSYPVEWYVSYANITE